jgi:hypothetical protein
MAATVKLALPLLEAAQAQKHVTHNDSLARLDSIVQLGVVTRTLAAPPGSPADGACYLVAAAPTGAWSGHAGHIAVWRDAAWAFHTAGEGWLAWVADENVALVYDGAAWQPYIGGRSPNGAACALTVIEEELTLSGASVTSTIAIPNGCICFGVPERVTQAVTGATSFKVGIGGETAKFGDLLGLTLGSTNFGIIGPTAFYADTAVVVTANGSNFTGGKVRIAIQCLRITPPQS